jgi:HAD superfamily hydrolase (TIGR01509 family)
MPREAVIFDVDGTLVDSERDGHRVAFNLAFEEAGLPYRWSVQRYGELLAITGGERRLRCYLAEEGVPAERAAQLAGELHRRKTQLFTEMVARGEIAPRPHVTELLGELAHQGVRLGIATTGTRAWVMPLLDRLFGCERFEVIVTGDDAPIRKPDPSAYHLALARLGIDAQSAMAVEDSSNGLRAALAAVLPCLVVVNDYTRGEDFAGAAIVLEDFANAAAHVKALLQR